MLEGCLPKMQQAGLRTEIASNPADLSWKKSCSLTLMQFALGFALKSTHWSNTNESHPFGYQYTVSIVFL